MEFKITIDVYNSVTNEIAIARIAILKRGNTILDL
jgi:hypothetical protein